VNYSQVVKAGYILPKKAKYTMRDCGAVLTDSLFGKYGPRTLSKREAGFIVVCSAIFHDTDYSMGVAKFRTSDTRYELEV
jgi:hypothetical protein